MSISGAEFPGAHLATTDSTRVSLCDGMMALVLVLAVVRPAIELTQLILLGN